MAVAICIAPGPVFSDPLPLRLPLPLPRKPTPGMDYSLIVT